MLTQLSIRNFALIDRLDLEFEEGFHVLTGETGAGKSILIDALAFVLGERAGVDLIRTGAEKALAEAVFHLSPEVFTEALARWAEEDQIVLSRELSRSGRSQCRINGRIATAGALREVAAHLVDLHGQHEHQSLLSPEKHVELLEAWAGERLQAPTRRARKLFAELQAVRREIRALKTDERERARRLDLYQFQIDEIDAADLVPGEEEELLADRSRLANAEKLFAAAAAALAALSEGDGDRAPAALDLLGLTARELEEIAALDESLGPVLESVQTALYAAEDAARALRDYQEKIEFNPARLEQVQERLELLRTLKKKYGDTIEEVLAYRKRIGAELTTLAGSEERVAELEARLGKLAAELDAAAAALYDARRQAAREFETALVAELEDLAMAATVFEVRVEPPRPATAAVSEGGTATPHDESPCRAELPVGDGRSREGLADVLGRVEFLISPNPGEPVKPLAKIASGGELSRVMLALKGLSAVGGDENRSSLPTLIFDEIDVGVGGRTAHALGEKLAKLGRRCQVLCVTHLPQIASRATAHYRVEKSVVGERTVVEVRRLEEEERVEEVARMLGGATATARTHAREMLLT